MSRGHTGLASSRFLMFPLIVHDHRECISCPLYVVVEVVLLHVLDARIAVVAQMLISAPGLFS